MDVFSVSADSLFPISSSQNAQKEQYALQYLEKGLTQFTEKNYQEAIQTLKQAVGLAPTAESAIDAYDYIASAYTTLGDHEAAIQTYKASIRAILVVSCVPSRCSRAAGSHWRYGKASRVCR